MKKYLKLFLLLIMFSPFIVNAESYEYQIVVDVNIENREIKENEFNFNLLDSSGNVIDSKRNSADGKVYFDKITFNTDDVYAGGCGGRTNTCGYKFYIVNQEIEDENIYIYDKKEAYIGAYLYLDRTSELHYL